MLARGGRTATRPAIGAGNSHPAFVHAVCRPAANGRAARIRMYDSRDAGTAMADAPPSVSGVSPYTPGDAEPPGVLDNLWQQNKQKQKYAALSKDTAADVVIIGAGIMGLSLAYVLAKNGVSVVVLEGRVRGAGQTGRTSAHIMQWNDDFFMQIEEKFGKDVTRQVAESHLAAADFIEQAVKDEKIDCNFRRVPGYLFPDGKDGNVTTLEEELAAIKTTGVMPDVKMVNLEGDPRNGSLKEALIFPRCADFHPLKYINGLAEAIVNKYGGKIFEGTNVDKILGPMTDGKVNTSTGYTVQARKAVVYATQSPCHHNLAIHGRQEAYRSYMLGVRIPKGSVDKAQWWDTKEIYHYIRTEEAGDHDVLIIGGGDHPCGQPEEEYTGVDIWARLEAYLRSHFPQCQEVVYRWSGEVFEPADQLHLFGLDPFDPFNAGEVKRYVLTGDSGQGMTGSAIAAMVVGDALQGKENKWQEVYKPDRIVSGLKSPMELAQELANIVRGYAEVPLLRDLTDVKGVFTSASEDIEPGTGKVVQQGLQKVAMFKDEAGNISKTSAICPHLGCIVEWNPNDKTFDCACHGSCFDRGGRLIQGPSQVGLKPLEDTA